MIWLMNELKVKPQTTVAEIAPLLDTLPKKIKDHSIRVADYSKYVYDKVLASDSFSDYKLLSAKEFYDVIKYHDLGKIGVPIEVLEKDELTPYEERQIIKHTSVEMDNEAGEKPNAFAVALINVMQSHHEMWDGSGYPRGLADEDIPLYARLCAIVNSYDNITLEKLADDFNYMDAHEYAMKKLASEKALKYDGELVDFFLAVEKDFLRLLKANFEKVSISKEFKDIKKEKKEQKEKKGLSLEDIEYIPIYPFEFRYQPVLHIEDQEVRIVDTEFLLFDPIKGVITSEEYFQVASKSARLTQLLDIAFNILIDDIYKIKYQMTKEMIVIKFSPKMVRNMKQFKELLARFEEVGVMSYNLCFSFYDDSGITPHDIDLVKHCGCKTMGVLGSDVYNAFNVVSSLAFDYFQLNHNYFVGLFEDERKQNMLKKLDEYIRSCKARLIITHVNTRKEALFFSELEMTRLQGNFICKPHVKLASRTFKITRKIGGETPDE
ncbi:MAG: EAL domain-containing protein [Candidatus Izemoplasmatales bacterium]|nr:EAL domain-containing protein [Candidatus Izemoplasmatales bacterium]